jgi:hypothetical protein
VEDKANVIAPLTDEQLTTFAEKLANFRAELAPHEQAALDAMVIRSSGSPETEVRGYDDGPGDRPNQLAGDDYVYPAGGVYAGPAYPVYAYPAGWPAPYPYVPVYPSLTRLYQFQIGHF